jgi:uncharacterized protein (UPF0548 family)
MPLKQGQRVYLNLVNEDNTISFNRYGTVHSDPIEGWDYVDVTFDDMPALVQPVLCYYLFPVADDTNEEGQG